MEDSMMCSTCFRLVKSAKEHCKTDAHRSFTYPVDGELNVTCLPCNLTLNYFEEVECHMQNTGHLDFVVMTGLCDVDVIFSVKKSKIADLEKISLFKDLK